MTGTPVGWPVEVDRPQRDSVLRVPAAAPPTAVWVTIPLGPVATIQPLCRPRSSLAGSSATGTSTLPPAGTVTLLGKLSASVSGLRVSRLSTSTARVSVTAAVVSFL